MSELTPAQETAQKLSAVVAESKNKSTGNFPGAGEKALEESATKEPEKKEQPAPEAKPAEPAKKAERKVSVFDDLAAPTEEDAGQKSLMESAAESFIEEDGDFQTEEEVAAQGDDSPKVKREMAKINAMIIVELSDVVFMLICMWASGDWSEEAQKKYTLVPQRKKAIQIPLFQILMRRKKKSNPIVSLLLLVLGSYAPMVTLAILSGVKRRRADQKAEEEKLSLQQQLEHSRQQTVSLQQRLQNQNAQQAFNAQNPAFNPPPVQNPSRPVKGPYKAPVGGKKSRGRHLHWCNAKKGGACNCAGYVHKPKCPANHGKLCNCYNK